MFRFWRRKTAVEDGATTHPLCRIRHATLHPGAALWTPGASGGSLGGGAAAALDEVRIGGVVAVGFQTSAREQVHPLGVLARVTAKEAFPDGADPTGLGAAFRYELVGLSRLDLDPESCSNKRVPTIEARPGATRLEDLAEAPAPLVDVLRALEALDNDWPTHWLDAFAALPRQPLGQWATTLGWRLAPEERLELFDNPERIADTLFTALEALHLGLAPEKRREALRAQTLTRRTTIMPHRWLTVEADTHGWALFHPSDLTSARTGATPTPAMTAPHPIAPSSSSEVANTIRCPVGETGTIAVLLTHTGISLPGTLRRAPPNPGQDPQQPRGSMLTPAEGFPSPVQRILVRHGRLFLGPAGLLHNPHPDRLDYLATDQWIDIPNGLFRLALIPLHGPELDAWLHAFPEQRNHPPSELLSDHGDRPLEVFAAVFEAVELADGAVDAP